MALFKEGALYPPEYDIERIAKYKRGKKIFDNKLWEVYDRATDLLEGTEHAEQLKTLYISIGVMDILCTKPADLLVGEPPKFESGKDSTSRVQTRLNEIAERNNLTQQLHEITTGNGYRGDAWIKTYFRYREDFSEVPEEYRDEIKAQSEREAIIEGVNAKYVFPEFAHGSKKRVKAVNIAWPEYVDANKREEVVYLNVERHVPGFIMHSKFRIYDHTVHTTYGDGAHVPQFVIGPEVEAARKTVPTGVPEILIEHIPYKAVDDDYYGISAVENLDPVLAAINDRITQIDYILWKHADPAMRGPDYGSSNQRVAGKYFPMEKEDPEPEYLTWNAQLDSAFREIDFLLGTVFQMSETPQWLFGTTLTPDSGGTGTSHTDAAAIKARFMPILSKVKRIRMNVDPAIRNALYKAQKLENEAHRNVEGWKPYEPVYPTITWSDGLPKNEKELAEIMQIRTGGKPTIDVHNAIKKQDDVNDAQARTIERAIESDEAQTEGFANEDTFREVDAEQSEGGDA